MTDKGTKKAGEGEWKRRQNGKKGIYPGKIYTHRRIILRTFALETISDE